MKPCLSQCIRVTGIAVFCFTLAIASLDTSAQDIPYTNQIREPLVKIGEKFPDFEFVISDHRMRKAKMSDFMGKVVVLDLMTIGCSYCITMLPQLDSIRSIVAKEAEVISIVPEDSLTINRVIQSRLKLKGHGYPFVYNDKIFHRLFPFDRFPAFVWIDKEGIVRSVTRSDYCRTENILELAAGKQVNWEIAVNKREPDLSIPIMPLREVANDLKFYSLITGEKKNYYHAGGVYVDSGKVKRISIVNFTIPAFYLKALEGNAIVDRSVPKFFEFSRPSLKSYKYEHEYLAQTSFCYEATFATNTTDKEISIAMLNDLNRYFNLNGHVEKRELWCIVIKDNTSSKPLNGRDKFERDSVDTMTVYEFAEKYAAAAFRREYRTVVKKDCFVTKYVMPVLIETRQGGAEKIIFRKNLQDLPADMLEQLKWNGLKLMEERRMIDVFVVSYPDFEKNRNNG